VSHGSPKRIASLDGLRGIAILLVILNHSLAVLGWKHFAFIGQHGVTLFFVLSGYLITSGLAAELERNGSIDLKGFYLRRFFRIQPAAWVYLAVLFFSRPGIEILSCVFAFRNYLPFQSLTSHFWSLSIEEQFYLVWPALFVLAGKRKGLIVAILGAVSIAGWRFFHAAPLSAGDAFFLSGSHTEIRADALFVGCAFALLPRIRGGVYLSLAGFFFCSAFVSTVPPLYESILIGVLVSSASHSQTRLLESRLLVQIGVASYSIYIWQHLVIFGLPFPIFIKLPLVFALGFLSYYCIEKPLILLNRKQSHRTAACAEA